MNACSGVMSASSCGLTATISRSGTAVKHSTTTTAPTASSAVTRKRLVHLMTFGPPSAMSVPSTTHRQPNIGFQTAALSTRPNFAARLIIDEENRLAATAYQPKFATLMIVDSTATPRRPSTERSQIHRSMP